MTESSKRKLTTFAGARGTSNQDWWPIRLNLKILHQHSPLSNPMGKEFNYTEDSKKLDLKCVKKDLYALMTDSKDSWPADFGHYGGLFIRMAWHSAGTYRKGDGRGGVSGGAQRFPPLDGWPTTLTLTKHAVCFRLLNKNMARKFLGQTLMILSPATALLESMGFKTLGFGGGREDIWEPQEDTYWGSETTWLD